MTSNATVFVVDDDAAVLRSLAMLLRIEFPRVETFASADAFLAAYQPGRPGCLLLDMAMPGMNGFGLQGALAERSIELPVVFLTGQATVPMAVTAMQRGAVGFLEKPCREEELWECIRAALARDEQLRRRQARRAQVEARLAGLSPAERVVFNLIVGGKSNKQIARQLGVSVRTIEDRRARMMRKTEADSLAELVQLAAGLMLGPEHADPGFTDGEPNDGDRPV